MGLRYNFVATLSDLAGKEQKGLFRDATRADFVESWSRLDFCLKDDILKFSEWACL